MYIKPYIQRVVSLLLLLSSIFLSQPFSPSAEETSHVPDAASFILMEKEERSIIAKSNERLSLPIASTTKILTCLVVIEQCSEEEVVTVDPQAVGIEGSSAYLRAGEKLTVKDLLYCLMLRSANDAATALALHISGSIEDFAYLMNEKATELGLENSHFENPHGLDHTEHYASAYDLALLCSYALDEPLFCNIVSTKSTVIGTGESARTLTNHNKLLFTLDGCIGVKTGYTMRAGRCLVSACKQEDTTLICVTLNCRDDWNAHKNLYSYGFSKVKRFSFDGFSADIPLAGADRSIHVRSESYTLLSTPNSDIRFVPVCPHLLFPSVSAGKEVGYVLVTLNGNAIDVLPITAREAGEAPPSHSILARIIAKILALFD